MADAFASFTRFAKKFQRGSVIFAEFDVGESFYLVQSGRVRLIKIINGKERYLDVLQPGEIFGEMSILDNSPRSASAVAYDDVVALEFNRENFEVLMMGNPAIAMRLLKTFVRRIYTQKRRFMILTIQDSTARVGDVFLMLDETQPHVDRSSDARSFDISIEEIARWAGLSDREVQDALRRLSDQRKVECQERRIVVKNMTDLNRYVTMRRGKGDGLPLG
ncbi:MULTISPECIES: Crp/Fnr family transcriptional regulator [Treponema]|uniref:Cyclic nucleotide-binding protein n=4 Tax=Treponema TaxID=157 RepID=F7XS88_TREPU|nr:MULTISPECIES: Crp/Fnr family transcriptional regulator [Treponema]AEH40213.1 cyclic nucleotide-binding protein [Treponema paraluiscuniculi Cuniculi A]AEZ57386.1 cyclic nucleotide-binding protein [Treponema pallidum subsp. pertenue str. SamoaD]AEZ58455.1 cyclic nucleotide-binding protein [Treponema pallidum subsp. pertenue str. CDC2]AEZ59523.1 cyclic nucleotide-binding protein [Treponema pallidum subsp. pertenue str. Gauthier]AGK83911.1 cyclic nucleotide-binding protein [Treponema pallidum s